MGSTLQDTLDKHVANGSVPGAVGLVARGGRVEVAVAGSADAAGASPMARDTICRIASMTKPITAAAAMVLVDDGRIALDQPISRWLPELASPSVVRTPDGPVDDVVPAARPATVLELLTFRAGWGFPSDFSLPAVAPLLELLQGPPQPQPGVEPDAWLERLARIPMLHQPGEGWLYNTCADILGVLIARAAGRPLEEFLAERLFAPLSMGDTGFTVPAAKLDRFAHYYRADPAGGLESVDEPDGQWSRPPVFPSGADGLVSTADDWYAFGRMLLDEGSAGGRRVLSPESVRRMTTDWLTPAEREASTVFLGGQGWGFGGSVDVAPVDPWNVPGRYGWVGGTGTAGHVDRTTGTVTVLLSQLEMAGPAPTELMRDFWRTSADGAAAGN